MHGAVVSLTYTLFAICLRSPWGTSCTSTSFRRGCPKRRRSPCPAFRTDQIGRKKVSSHFNRYSTTATPTRLYTSSSERARRFVALSLKVAIVGRTRSQGLWRSAHTPPIARASAGMSRPMHAIPACIVGRRASSFCGHWMKKAL